jgi:hypothetical protein
VNVIRIAALSVLLAASAAGAQQQSTKKAKEAAQAELAKVSKPIVTEKDKPKTCSDQCALMEKVMADSCKKGAGDNKAGQQGCQSFVENMVTTCEGSCAEKGRIDKQYMMERLKPVGGGKMPKGAQSSGAEGEGDEH